MATTQYRTAMRGDDERPFVTYKGTRYVPTCTSFIKPGTRVKVSRVTLLLATVAPVNLPEAPEVWCDAVRG